RRRPTPSATARAPSYGYRARHPGRLAQRADLGGRIGRGEDRIAGDERVRAGAAAARDRLPVDAAVDLEPRAAAYAVEHRAGAGDLAHAVLEEPLRAEARVHRHDKQQVELVRDLLDVGERRRRVQRDAG